MMNDVAIVAASRTAIGKFGGVFKSLNALDLTLPVMKHLAGVILMSVKKARELGIGILATISGTATTGCDPEIMGIGPVSAIKKALEKTRLALDEIDLIELNEAFAAQYLACEKALGLDRNITNVNGSGVGLGHPVGATGARLITTLLYEMKRRNLKRGLAALCAGGGMGCAMIFQRV